MITEQSSVTLHFALKTADGYTIDSNFAGRPARFTMGDGSLLPGFEKLLLGLRPGQTCSFRILPETGFGQTNPNNVQTLSRQQFGSNISLQPGLVVNFTDAAQGEVPGVIKAVTSDQVVVDFNHPLAGRELCFEVKIVQVD